MKSRGRLTRGLQTWRYQTCCCALWGSLAGCGGLAARLRRLVTIYPRHATRSKVAISLLSSANGPFRYGPPVVLLRALFRKSIRKPRA